MAQSQAFPPLPQFSQFMKPCRFEGETLNLEVIGTIPPEVRGTFYRVMPDPQLPPRVENDPVRTSHISTWCTVTDGSLFFWQWFNGDGNISSFRIESGRVHFKQRYVRTEKFVKEREAQRALLGTLPFASSRKPLYSLRAMCRDTDA